MRVTSALATLAAVTAFFLLYSPSIEKNKIITISKPLVINQERRTPAYFLYQQIQSEIEDQKSEKSLEKKTEVTTYLNNENLIQSNIQMKVSEMHVARHEIASEVDAGFVSSTQKTFLSTSANKLTADQPLLNQISVSQATDKVNQPKPSDVGFFEKWATIKGKFEMRGVGVVDQFIELKRIEEGITKEVGKIDLVAGTYSIDIKSPKGLLVAEIHDKNGILIGEDRQKIINLQSKGRYFEGPFIQVKHPDAVVVNPGIPKKPSMSVASNSDILNTNGKSKSLLKSNSKNDFTVSLFSEQNLLDNPFDEFSNISKYSSTISTIEDKNLAYRKVLSIRQTGDKSLTPVFTEKYINGILEYISDQEKMELRSKNISVLIGKVQVDQKPKSGIQVQIENHPGVNPIYLDQFMIPNTKLTETTESGLFIFIGLESDLYTVTAFLQNRIIGHQLFLTEENLISFQTIETTQAGQDFIVRSFDAFNGDRKDIDLITPDFDEVLNSENGELNYKKTNNLGVSEFIIRPIGTDYLPIRYFQDSRKEFLHIPNIKEAWLKQIALQKQINEDQSKGIYIGFVPEMNYELFLVYEGFNKENIIYFDSHGILSSNPVKGGGFVVFNVPLDAHEFIVQESGTDTIYSQVFSVKSGQISMSHFIK